MARTVNRSISNVFKEKFDNLKYRSMYVDKANERGLINPKTRTSVVLKKNGDVSIAAGLYAQNKVCRNGKIEEVCIEKNIKSNRIKIETEDFIINNHKMNPKIYELTGMKKVMNQENSAVGNLTFNSTVLVKAWDEDLNKYVLIRRPVRIPIFSNDLNAPEVMKELNTESNIENELKSIRELLEAKERGE